MELPLQGCTVLDLSQVIAGPETAMILGEMGANVVKVEKPGGEDSRSMGLAPSGAGISRTFSVLNRNKRSLILDLAKPAGKDVLHRLAARADVLIEGFIPGAADRLGIGYDALSSLNPRLIYASISGFGTRGPYAGNPAYDLVLQGMSGVMAARRWPDGTPIAAPIWVGDASAPFMLAWGITLALLAREKTGRGQKVETSLLHAQIAMQGTQLVRLDSDAAGMEDLGSAVFQPYRCGDGEYINITILNERQWRGFCGVLDIHHLAQHPDYDSVAKRTAHRDELYGLIGGLLGTRPSGEWLDLLHAAGVPSGPVIPRDRVFDSPQAVANEMFLTREQPGLGVVTEMTLPVHLSDARPEVRRSAPFAGQHTVEVLREFGFGPEEIAELQSTAVVVQSAP